MKKRTVIIIVAVLVIAAVVAVIFLTGPKTKPAPADESVKTEQPKEEASGAEEKSGAEEQSGAEEEPDEPMPEPGTVIIDKGVTATFGVAKGDAELFEEEDEPKGSSEPTGKPEQKPTTDPTTDPIPEEPAKASYETFYALPPEQKDEFLNSFESYQAFYDWLVAAQEEFTDAHPDMEIGPDGSIDLSKMKK